MPMRLCQRLYLAPWGEIAVFSSLAWVVQCKRKWQKRSGGEEVRETDDELPVFH